MITHHDAIQDAIVIGAGPAGLTAAIYLGRFRRRCLVLEHGESRARWIPTSHNIPGFAAGIGGEEFSSSLREQALKYGAQLRRALVSRITVAEDGLFSVRTAQGTHRSHFVLLATGVKDHLPAIEGASEAILRSLVRSCPICDAYEAIDKRIAVIGDGALGEREAAFLRHYSNRVTLLQLGPPKSEHDERPPGGDIERVAIDLSDLRLLKDRVALKTTAGERHFEVIYLALGCSSQNRLARSLNARCDENGALMVSAHQETTVPQLYAAGDVVRGLNQVVVAAAESAIAATDIHNKLRERK
jgi:thioredoxin reductase (NADPH)